MSNIFRFTSYFVVLALAGCVNGDKAPFTPPVVQAETPVGQPPSQFPPAALVRGTWSGTLSHNVRSSSEDVLVWVTDDLRIRVLGFDFANYDHSDSLMRGQLMLDGNDLTGSGVAYAGTGAAWSDGSAVDDFTLSATLGGTVSDGYTFTGTWSTAAGDSGSIDLIRDYADWGGGSPADRTSTWSTGADLQSPFSQVDISIMGTGNFVGHDLQGCNFTGRFFYPVRRDLFVDTEMHIADCELAGDYQGLALSDGWANAFHLSADDGVRALLLTFWGQ